MHRRKSISPDGVGAESGAERGHSIEEWPHRTTMTTPTCQEKCSKVANNGLSD